MEETSRILSYNLATVLKPIDLEQVSGGGSVRGTIASQYLRSTINGDTTIDLDFD